MKRSIVALAVLALCAMLAACGHTPATVGPLVRVPVPVECRVQTPTRPAMPTEALTGDEPLDTHLKSAHAEIALREGYEGRLVAALATCTAPLKPAADSAGDARTLPAGPAGATPRK